MPCLGKVCRKYAEETDAAAEALPRLTSLPLAAWVRLAVKELAKMSAPRQTTTAVLVSKFEQ